MAVAATLPEPGPGVVAGWFDEEDVEREIRAIRRLVGDSDCGIPVDPMEPSAAAAAIEQLVKDPDEVRRLGANGRRASLERYNWGAEFPELYALYQRLG